MSPSKRSKSDETGLVQFDEADPSVSAILRRHERLQSEAKLPKRKREKLARERERMHSRKEVHTTYDIPPELRAWMKQYGEQLEIPASQLATLALLRFVRDVEAGQIDLDPYRQPSASPRYSWNLVIPIEQFGLKKR